MIACEIDSNCGAALVDDGCTVVTVDDWTASDPSLPPRFFSRRVIVHVHFPHLTTIIYTRLPTRNEFRTYSSFLAARDRDNPQVLRVGAPSLACTAPQPAQSCRNSVTPPLPTLSSKPVDSIDFIRPPFGPPSPSLTAARWANSRLQRPASTEYGIVVHRENPSVCIICLYFHIVHTPHHSPPPT